MTFARSPAFKMAIVVAVVVCGLGLMQLVYAVRIKELGQNLESSADKTMALRTLGLIARYEMIQSRVRNGETIALLRKEVTASFAANDSLASEKREELPAAYELGLGIINIVNVIAGGKKIQPRKKTRIEYLMEEAYLLELQRNFSAAVKIYDQLIGDLLQQQSDLMSFARLHRGYCLSFIDARERAAEDFGHVIAANTQGEYRFTAEVLLSYLEEFSRRAAAISSLPLSIEKGSALFNAGAYPKAIEVLEALPAGRKNEQSHYVLGRSYEEIGKSTQAIANYRKLIAQHPRSKYAKMANRRLYALGSVYGGGESLVKESEAVAQKIIPDADLMREKKKNTALVAAVQEKRVEIATTIRREKNPGMPVPVATQSEPAKGVDPRAEKIALPVRKPLQKPILAQKADNPSLTRGERKQIIAKKSLIDEVTLSDGNRLWGIILEEKNNSLTMMTVMGKLSIDKDHIQSREKIEITGAFKPRSQ